MKFQSNLQKEYGKPGQMLLDIFLQNQKLLVITGAGMSTDSGVPDYRSPNRPIYKPLMHQQFIKDEYYRRRYWARSMIGYPIMKLALPNHGHICLTELEKYKLINYLITQNVDRLHQKSGYKNILELHGSIHEVECLNCNENYSREKFQEQIQIENQKWSDDIRLMSIVKPDGDAELPKDAYDTFVIPKCLKCQSQMLKPKVVFFGDSIPKNIVDQSMKLASESDAILVIGSTLSTFSALRLVDLAYKNNKVIGILNIGETRGDSMTTFKIEKNISQVLNNLLNEINQLVYNIQ